MSERKQITHAQISEAVSLLGLPDRGVVRIDMDANQLGLVQAVMKVPARRGQISDALKALGLPVEFIHSLSIDYTTRPPRVSWSIMTNTLDEFRDSPVMEQHRTDITS